MPLAAVVLAGGRATRFPGKLAARGLHGEGLAARVYRLASLAAGVAYVSTRGIMEGLPRRALIFDEPGLKARGCRGPLLGILSAARHADRLLIVSGDMGYLPLDALRSILNVSVGFEATMLYWCGGLLEPLLAVIDSSLASRVEPICGLLEPRPTLLARLARSLLLYPVSLLAVDPSLLASINTPLDLISPRPRGRLCKGEPLVLKPPLARAERIDAEVLIEEARWWLERGLYHLALHAALDAVKLGGGVEAEKLAVEAQKRLGVRLHEGSLKG